MENSIAFQQNHNGVWPPVSNNQTHLKDWKKIDYLINFGLLRVLASIGYGKQILKNFMVTFLT